MAGPVVGEIRMLAGSDVPPGWAACDGQVLQIREHKSLFAVLGATYGGDGKSTFALPDLRGRTPVHHSHGTLNLGHSGGEITHAISASEVPAHAHGAMGMIGVAAASTGVQLAASPSSTTTLAAANTISIAATGSQSEPAEGHDNLQPYLTVSFVIALEGASPGRK